MENFTQVATIPKTAQRCQSENLGVTEWQLRCWCKTGAIPTVKAGQKSLIYWPNLLKFLETGKTFEQPSPPPTGTVRKIAE